MARPIITSREASRFSLIMNGSNSVSVPITLPATGSIIFNAYVTRYFNYGSLWDSSANLDKWESWIYATGKIAFRTNNALLTGNVDFPGLRQWVTVGMTWTSGGVSTLYINGVAVGSTQTVAATPTSGTTFYWGGGNAGNTKGEFLISDARIYNTALSANDMWKYYYSGATTQAPLVWHKFSEGMGTVATDYSGNGYHGTITSALWSKNAPPTERVSSDTYVSTATSPDTGCHQGIASDGTYFYGIHTTALKKFDFGWNLITENTSAATQAGVTHLGDGQYYDGKLYVIAEDFTSVTVFSNQRIAVFDASDLSFIEYHDISAQGVEVSGLCIDAPNDAIYVSNYSDGDKIYRYKLSDFSYVGAITLSSPIDATQGITIHNNHFYIGESTNHRIYKLDLAGNILNYSKVCTFQEGLDYGSGTLYALDDTGKIVRTVGTEQNRRSLYGSTYSVRLNGTNSSVTAPLTALNSSTTVLTIAFRAYIPASTSGTDQILICNGPINADTGWCMRKYSSGRMYLYHNSKAPSFIPKYNQWNSYVLIFERNSLYRVYENGNLVISQSITDNELNRGFLKVGVSWADTAVSYFSGNICDVNVIVGAAPTEAQIRQFERYVKNLPARTYEYLLGEGSGTTAIDTAGGNNGTIANGTWSTFVPSRGRG